MQCPLLGEIGRSRTLQIKDLGPVSRKYLSLSSTQFHSTRADPYPILCDLPELSEIECYSDLSIFEKLGPRNQETVIRWTQLRGGLVTLDAVADPGGSRGSGPPPPFGPRCRLFNPKLDPLLDPPFFACRRLRWTPVTGVIT